MRDKVEVQRRLGFGLLVVGVCVNCFYFIYVEYYSLV